MASIALIYGIMLAGIIALCVQRHLQDNREAVAIPAIPASRKHIRITHNALSGGKITYYNEAGRKVTSRRTESSLDLYRFIASARSKGYRTI